MKMMKYIQSKLLAFVAFNVMGICLRFLCGEFSKAKHVILELGGIIVQ